MILTKIKVKNYRLLKDFELDLEKVLSLIIGKNNTGKTSLLTILEKTIGEKGKRSFSFEDFNIEFKDELKILLESDIIEENYPFTGISLKLFISYDEKDDLINISRIMMDLEPENSTVVLGFEYALSFSNYQKLKSDYVTYKAQETLKASKRQVTENAIAVTIAKNEQLGKTLIDTTAPTERANIVEMTKDICNFLSVHLKDYFSYTEKAISYNIDDKNNPYEDDKIYIDLTALKERVAINKIISFEVINARRDVSNKEPNKALSALSSNIYKKAEANQAELEAIDDFKYTLSKTDVQLDGIYAKLFEDVIAKVRQFGGIKQDDSIIEIISTLQHRELLEGNTTVMYKHDEKERLPEHYNGLGYMNLISMIFEIEILLQKFKKDKNEKPADINLLFIEEPEAHTHPQMQYIFMKNIKALLEKGITRDDGENRDLQTIVSTHSSHIVSESFFNDIKYFKREKKIVVAKNLKDLIKAYKADPKQYEFLKQYLTISRAELFFADKAILIEGDTERILLPTIMKKMDVEYQAQCDAEKKQLDEIPLLSQNISIVEVGAYSQIFEKFIDFLGIKSLIITDLDTTDAAGESCQVADGVGYSNSALSFFLSAPTLQKLKEHSLVDKILHKSGLSWIKDSKGRLCIIYQTLEDTYNARSFEDSFIHVNRAFIDTHKDSFRGLKNARYLDAVPKHGPYYLANNCIKKKTHFALDILYHSDTKFSNWQIPAYIKEGLTWLKQD